MCSNSTSRLETQPHGLPNSKSRPLVSLILLGFNSERFIRAAIEGALSQTYQPLEIILSDDCSADGTFKIMKDMAATYHGPHAVRLNRCEENLGTFRHFLSAFKQCQGELIVQADGDDVSLPHRVEMAVKSWKSTGAAVMSSAYHEIDEQGIISSSHLHLKSFFGGENLFLDVKGPEIVGVCGCVGCYDRALLGYLVETDLRFDCDDFIISYVANKLRRPPVHINDSLIFYRRHTDAVTHFPHSRDAIESEQRALRFYRNVINMLKYIKIIDDRISEPNQGCRPTNWKYVDMEIKFIETVLEWDKFTTTRRMKNIFVSLGNVKRTRWKLSRLFGKHPKYYPVQPIKNTLAVLRNRRRCVY